MLAILAQRGWGAHSLTVAAQNEGGARVSKRSVRAYLRFANPPDATIAVEMAKFKPVRAKAKRTAPTKGGIPCIILLASGFALMLLFLYIVMKSFHSS